MTELAGLSLKTSLQAETRVEWMEAAIKKGSGIQQQRLTPDQAPGFTCEDVADWTVIDLDKDWSFGKSRRLTNLLGSMFEGFEGQTSPRRPAAAPLPQRTLLRRNQDWTAVATVVCLNRTVTLTS